MATGDRVLPIYSGDETDLYFQVDGGYIYKEGDVDRDVFSGDVTVKAGSSKTTVNEYTSFLLSYWDANRGHGIRGHSRLLIIGQAFILFQEIQTMQITWEPLRDAQTSHHQPPPTPQSLMESTQ